MESIDEKTYNICRRDHIAAGTYYLENVKDRTPYRYEYAYIDNVIVHFKIDHTGWIQIDDSDRLGYVVILTEEEYQEILREKLGL
jgi:hypothetical protein